MARILIVDDEPEVVHMVTKIMEAEGHEVISALDGRAGLDAASRDAPDVILLDVHLPQLDGFEVCRRLKSADGTRDIPVVMMTAAEITVEDARRGTGIGADEYVVKPFVREILVHNVSRLLGGETAGG